MKRVLFFALLLISCYSDNSFEDLKNKNQEDMEFSRRRRLRFSLKTPPVVPQDNTYLQNYVAQSSPPAYLGTYVPDEWDANIHANHTVTITRVADVSQPDFNDDYSLRHNYATEAVWNSDGTVIKLGNGSSARFLDASDYSVLPFSTPISNGFHWSKVRNNRTYGHWNNGGDYTLYKVDYDWINNTENEQNVHGFLADGYTEMKFEGAHNEGSNDDVFALHGRKASNSNVWIVIYDAENEQILYEHELTWVSHDNDYDGAGGLRWIKVSPYGNFIVVGYVDTGSTAQNAGIWAYPIDDINSGIQLSQDRGHGDVGIAINGKEIFINFENYNSYEYSAIQYDLDNGTISGRHLPLSLNVGWGHISCRNTSMEGWAFITLEGNQSGAINGDGQLTVIAVRLDDTQKMKIYCRTRNLNVSSRFDHSTMAVPNPNGTQVIFVSDWDGHASLTANNTGTAFIAKVKRNLGL